MNQTNRKKLQQFISELVKQEGLPPNSVFAIETAFLLWQTEMTHDQILSQKPKPSVQQLANISHVFMGFNGVLTNNKVYFSAKGEASFRCDRSDVIGIRQLKSIGKYVGIISSDNNAVVENAASLLELESTTGCIDKALYLRDWMKTHNVDPSRAAFVGSALHDLGVMQQVGLKLCTADANPEVMAVADYVLPKLGGEGVIREVSDLFRIDLSEPSLTRDFL